MGLLNPLEPSARNTFGTTFSKSHEVDKIENYPRAAQGILEDVRRRVSQEQDRVSLKKNQALRPSNFKVGQMVLIKKDAYMKPKPGQKFHFLWYGPYAILEVINPNSYRVETGTDTLRHCVLNARDLKPFSKRENDYGRIPPLTREAQLANFSWPTSTKLLVWEIWICAQRKPGLKLSERMQNCGIRYDYRMFI
ncbi:uncharacterized protein KNAG_0A06945 [Huiozyma naganishii CBS 8797]|uniref:Uncharacterized protein n=1 Tax=Huiozyma naganishii (strain ATCC MYA-139 / BCRC 22969 / CBS 8797 / KCTC 17520 / NBRC 10181 / NCYC 3082 / Yp74L-3) TaxID=1071383 RepID=J7RFM4_HUIN7|nr:hypothetical protein KNAG_0A06945 [Kazachstania naganishii CBS 8797]CCK68348.1 hypothetical protein KNAG_0A06945 [Kazachstania naganishii CBS 8797]